MSWRIETELTAAILNEDTKALDKCLDLHNVTVDHVFNDNRTLLQLAVDERRTNIVKYLVHKHCDVNKVGSALRPFSHQQSLACLDKSNLFRAICCGDLEIVKALVKGGANLSLQDELGCTALWHAVDSGNYDIVETILASKTCNVNQSDHHGITPLHVASIHGHHKIVRLLIRYRAKLDVVQMDGASPLCLATNSGAKQAMTVLLQHGADPTHQLNSSSMCPITLAIDQGANRDIVEQLTAAGAQVPASVRYLSHPTEMRGTRKVDDEETFHWLANLSKIPRSLKDSCSLKIRQILLKKSRGITICCLTEKLPLPNVLKDYLHLKYLLLR